MTDRLTQREVCQRLGVCCKTLQTLRRRRKIGYVQFGHRTIRFRESDVEQFITKRERAVLFATNETPEVHRGTPQDRSTARH